MIHLIITKRYYRCELEHRDTLSRRSETLLKRKRQQTSIITLYKIVIGQYDPEHKLYIEEIFDLIPSELNSKNKRFILKNLNENFKFSRYTNSFIWLKDAGVALPTFCASEPVVPLKLSQSTNPFKIKILNHEKDINYGSVYENAAAQELTAHGFDLDALK